MQARIWPRLGAVSGVLYVVLLMGSTSTGSDAQIVIVLELIAILLFLPFLGYLYGVLRRAEGEGACSMTATLLAVYFGGIVVLRRLFVVLTGERPPSLL
jgi:hypothetical protein